MNVIKVKVVSDKTYYVNADSIMGYNYNDEADVTNIFTSVTTYSIRGDKTKELTKILTAAGRMTTLE